MNPFLKVLRPDLCVPVLGVQGEEGAELLEANALQNSLRVVQCLSISIL